MKFCVPFLIIPNVSITAGIIFVLSFQILVTSISRSLYFESFWNSFNEMFWSEGTATSIMMQVRPSWFFIIISGMFVSIHLNKKSHSMITFFLSTAGSGVCLYHFSVCSISVFATKSCRWRYSMFTIIGHVVDSSFTMCAKSASWVSPIFKDLCLIDLSY